VRRRRRKGRRVRSRQRRMRPSECAWMTSLGLLYVGFGCFYATLGHSKCLAVCSACIDAASAWCLSCHVIAIYMHITTQPSWHTSYHLCRSCSDCASPIESCCCCCCCCCCADACAGLIRRLRRQLPKRLKRRRQHGSLVARRWALELTIRNATNKFMFELQLQNSWLHNDCKTQLIAMWSTR
jgi:hypothetical protein